jgi:hypothetical protein
VNVSPDIYSLIDSVLASEPEREVSNAAIIKCLDPHLIFETQLPVKLCTYYLTNQDYLPSVLSVFAEIVSLPKVPPRFWPLFRQIFVAVVSSILTVGPATPNGPGPLLEADAGLLKTLIFTISTFLSQYGQAFPWMLHILSFADASLDADNFRNCCELSCASAADCEDGASGGRWCC